MKGGTLVNLVDNQGVNLRNICFVLADFLTHSQINDLLSKCKIENKGIPTKHFPNGFGYIPGSNKVDKLYDSFANEINKSQSTSKLTVFGSYCNPISYVNIDRDKYSRFYFKVK